MQNYAKLPAATQSGANQGALTPPTHYLHPTFGNARGDSGGIGLYMHTMVALD